MSETLGWMYTVLKLVLQKRIRVVKICQGKPLGCHKKWMFQGLQCGLSGNQVASLVTTGC